MALKLPRAIRLDPSDTFVYSRAAEPGEWAVTGTFLFFGADPAALAGKERQAFRGGFLGVESFGWSTLVVVTEARDEDRSAAVETLAERLIRFCGAPNLPAARAAAEEEIAFAASLCDHPPATLLGIRRGVEGGAIRETFRTLHRRADRLQPLGAFRVVEVEEEDGPAEEVDLVKLVQSGRT
jgi:hypothetical protein